jgi:succinate dehydrogenase / fumarate reductase flavoprotein subunit
MRIFPALHYSMGGLWVDYNLMSNVPGLFVIGEANFSDHGANRLGASALMQGLADGYFVLPSTIGGYLAGVTPGGIDESHAAVQDTVRETTERLDKVLSLEGNKTVDEIHRELGQLLWDHCGMARNKEGLLKARDKLPGIREDFWANATVLGARDTLNQSLEYAGRVADFLELAPFLVEDALSREESCGCHFREEHQTEDNEAMRNDEDFTYVAAWEFKGVGEKPTLHKEELTFDTVKPATRSYK